MRYTIIGILLMAGSIGVTAQDIMSLNAMLKKCVYVGDCHNGHILIKDTEGYDYINIKTMKKTNFHFTNARDFSNGAAWVETKERWCIMDTCGQIVPTSYVEVQPFSDGLALVTTASRKKIFVNKKGEKAFHSDFTDAKSFNEGMAAASELGKWGFIDSDGKWVIPPTYNNVQSYSDGVAPVNDGDGWHFVYPNGKRLTERSFKYVSPFRNGAAIVQEKLGFDREVMLKDTSIVYSATNIMPFSSNYAAYKLNQSSDGTTHIAFNGKYGYLQYDSLYSLKGAFVAKGIRKVFINSNVFTAIAPLYDAVQPFSEGYFAVCKDGKWTYLDTDGVPISDFSFNAAYPFSEGLARVKKDGHYEFIRGEEVISRNKQNDKFLGCLVDQFSCLGKEGQYEILIDKGYNILCSLLHPSHFIDLDSRSLYSLQKILNLSCAAQNQLMAIALGLKEKRGESALYDYYKAIKMPHSLSYQQGQFSLNTENDERNFGKWAERSKRDSLYDDLTLFVDRKEYKRAVLTFEKIIEDKSIDRLSYDELKAYLFLLEQSGDFELANVVMVYLAKTDMEGLQVDDFEKAVCMAEIRRFASAEKLFKKAMGKARECKDWQLVGLCCHNMAMMYDAIDDERNASLWMKKAVNEYQKVNSGEVLLDALAWLLSKDSNLQSDEYSSYLSLYTKEEMKHEAETFQMYDMGRLRYIWGHSKERINSVLSRLVNMNDNRLYPMAYELTIFSKNFILDTQCLWQKKAIGLNDEEISRLLAKYNQLRSEFRGIDIFNVRDNEQYFQALPICDTECKIKERILSLCNSYIDTSDYNCSKSVLNAMRDNDIAVEFFDYISTCNDDCTAAWILSKEGINLVKNIPNDSTVWNVILEKKEAGKVFFSTSSSNETKGLEFFQQGRNKLPFAFSHETHRITSTKLIANVSSEAIHIDSLYLFGGLDYGYSFSSEERGIAETGYLEYSLKEINGIEEIMSQKVGVKSYVDVEGTVKSFLENEYTPFSCIHIATHGWQLTKKIDFSNFFGYDRFNYYRQNTDLESEDWLLNSTGLYMSSDDILSDSISNILLAKDIAVKNLRNTVLVVLSACSTIKGNNSDGYSSVIGLDYALQRASAQNIVSSLRDVDDEKTYEFMMFFYQNLLTYGIHNAFWNATKEMWKKYSDKPDYWTSFVLLENPVKS